MSQSATWSGRFGPPVSSPLYTLSEPSGLPAVGYVCLGVPGSGAINGSLTTHA
ncbi:hypothetical protein [Streptomyces sp. NPDC101165]|uniref:hypothetical protein n=1 Tax=Streptomyces sp. NPDC101165 TaxID=3366119 RepID=UPI0037F237FD